MNDYAVPYAQSPLPSKADYQRVDQLKADGSVPPSGGATVEHTPLHALDLETKGNAPMKQTIKIPVIAAVIVIAAGIATGYGGARLKAQSLGSISSGGTSQPISKVATGAVKVGDVFGVQDENTFKDKADGYLEAGGLDGEGSHRLLRAGGESQTVYLTSSVTDLAKFEGMEVKVWGETFKAQKAGWLMDVGRVEVVNPSGTPPTEE